MTTRNCLSLPDWECGKSHKVGCYFWQGLIYVNHKEGNSRDPRLGITKGETSGGFNVCGLIDYLMERTLDRKEAELETTLCGTGKRMEELMLPAYASCTSYGLNEAVMLDGLIYESLVKKNKSHPQNGTGDVPPTWVGGFHFSAYIRYVAGQEVCE